MYKFEIGDKINITLNENCVLKSAEATGIILDVATISNNTRYLIEILTTTNEEELNLSRHWLHESYISYQYSSFHHKLLCLITKDSL